MFHLLTPRGWRLALAFVGGSTLIAGVAAAAPAYRTSGSSHEPVTVRALGLDTTTPVTGQPVSAGAKVVARTDRILDQVVLAVRGPAGENVDFPGTTDFPVGPAERTYTSTRTFNQAGTYTFWFAYRDGSTRWHDLTPQRTFTVSAAGGGVTPTPSASTSSAAPSPSISTSTAAPSPSATSPSPSTTATSPSPSTATSPTVATGPLGVSGSWRSTFHDEFSAPIAWGTTWADSSSAEADGGHGNPGNQQLEWNQRQNCAVSGGVLTLTAKPDSITSPSGRHYNWSSCLLSSAPSYAFRYGYIEMRAQLPADKGFWPAFWTWQAAGNNTWTETDVFEYYSDNPTALYLTQHSGAGGGTIYHPSFNPSTGYHVYGADIEPGGTTFYIDGRAVYTAPGTSTGNTNIIVDNFVYSQIPPAAGSTGQLKVDYVRAWQH